MEARNNLDVCRLEKGNQRTMTIPLISIIVAIYNVEDYLAKCIESILNQTYTNIELILVVDGSHDGSLNICQAYAAKDSRITIVQKENGGQSTARNAGLEIARGEYVGFVDGDDWIEPEMYQTLYDLMVKNDADIVQCGWHIANDMGNIVNDNPTSFYENFTSDDALDELILPTDKHINTSVCSKLFRRKIVENCRFSPVRAYEDDEFIFRTVGGARKIVCIDTPLYDYFNRANSTMTARFNINKVALVTIQDNICRYIKTRYPKRFNEAQKTLCSKQFYILHCLWSNAAIEGAPEAAKKLQEEILQSYDDYMANPLMGQNKLMLWIFRYLPKSISLILFRLKFRVK